MSRSQFKPEVIDLLLFYLRQKLSVRYRDVDEHVLEASIEDALLRFAACPEQFDMSRSPDLGNYLTLWVRSYLGAGIRKEVRHRQHEKAVGVSERNFEKTVSEARGERCIHRGRDRSEQETEELDRERSILNAIVARLNPRDRDGAELLRAGASFEEWVCYLRIEQLPLKEQRHKVNAEKDRLMKKLKREVRKMQE